MPDSNSMQYETSTPAVVLGCFRQGGIGIVRSLGRLGVPVYAIDVDRFAAAFFSRFCRGTFRWDINRSSANESLQFVTEVGNKIGRRAVLIPTSDIGAMFVAAYANQLADRFLFPEQPESLMRSLCSKRGMHDIAKRFNVPTPETSFPASEEDVRSYISTARFPILVKPLYNKPSTVGARRWHMFLAHTEQELLDRYRAIEDPLDPNIILRDIFPVRIPRPGRLMDTSTTTADA